MVSAFPSVLIRVCFFLAIVALAACKQEGTPNQDKPIEVEVAVSSAQTVDPAAGEYTVWETAPNPESVTIDGIQVYVAHFGDKLEPLTQDGDGYIAKYDADGTRTGVLVEGLDAPKGTELVGSTLFVADVDTLFGFSTSTGERKYAVSFTGTSQFLNGLCKGPSGELFVTGTDVGKVWRVQPGAGTFEEVASVPGANGVVYDESANAIYVVNFLSAEPMGGAVHKVNLNTGEMTVVGDYRGLLDGLIRVERQLFFTDWSPVDGEGKMVQLDLDSGASTVVAADSLFAGPANFDVLGDGLALVPMLTGSKVVAVRLR